MMIGATVQRARRIRLKCLLMLPSVLLQQIYVAAVQNITSLSFVEIYEVLSIVSGYPSAALIAVVPRQMSSLPSAFSEKNVIIRLLGCFEAQFCCCKCVQLLLLCCAIQEIVAGTDPSRIPNPSVPDSVKWLPHKTGIYTDKSAWQVLRTEFPMVP
ncbi:hypothetical protein RHMOL_Rhmol13G0159800 [Rhododendron molle]|uniref:Uncharacterized protein n=1 Tax=Rhododendron molle TaxID=49168 RepID=A0ACC0L784_RHOML|nr:hypothetical protein RHMOL_Rhmol13G0159800 [Rhododendron molle]